jgi:hypothetical protein
MAGCDPKQRLAPLGTAYPTGADRTFAWPQARPIDATRPRGPSPRDGGLLDLATPARLRLQAAWIRDVAWIAHSLPLVARGTFGRDTAGYAGGWRASAVNRNKRIGLCREKKC